MNSLCDKCGYASCLCPKPPDKRTIELTRMNRELIDANNFIMDINSIHNAMMIGSISKDNGLNKIDRLLDLWYSEEYGTNR